MAPRDSNPPPAAPGNGKPPAAGKRTGPSLITGGWWIWAIVFFGVFAILLLKDQFGGSERLSYGEFKRQLTVEKNLSKVQVTPSVITGELKTIDKLQEEYRKNPMPSNTQYGWVWVGDGEPTVPVGG